MKRFGIVQPMQLIDLKLSLRPETLGVTDSASYLEVERRDQEKHFHGLQQSVK